MNNKMDSQMDIKLMLNILKKVSIITSIVFIVGCSHKPREVEASLPLVSSTQAKPNKKEIPSQYWSQLADRNATNIAHDKYDITLMALYTSALGLPCRELILIDKSNNQTNSVSNTNNGIHSNEIKRIACEIAFINKNDEQEKAWFLEKQIIESTSYVEL